MWKWIFSGALATLLTAIIGFGTRVYLSYEVEKNDLVIYYAIIDAVFYVVIFLSAFKDPFVTLYNSAGHRQVIRNAYGVGYLLSMTICCLFIIPSLYFFYLSERLNIEWIHFWLIQACFILIGITLFILPFFTASRIYAVLLVKDLLKATVFLASVIVWIIWLGTDFQWQSIGLIVSFMASELVLITWLTVLLKRHQISMKLDLNRSFKTVEVREFFKNCAITLVTYLFSHLSTLGVPLIMLWFYQTDDVADFMVVARPIYSSLIAIFSFAVFKFMFPEMTHLIAMKKFNEILKIRKKFRVGIVIFGIFAITGCWLMSDWLISLVFPTEYSQSYQMVNILIVALPFVIYSSFSRSIIKGGQHYSSVMYIQMAGACTFLLLFFWISQAGLGIRYSPLAIVGDVIMTSLICLMIERRVLQKLTV